MPGGYVIGMDLKPVGYMVKIGTEILVITDWNSDGLCRGFRTALNPAKLALEQQSCRGGIGPLGIELHGQTVQASHHFGPVAMPAQRFGGSQPHGAIGDRRADPVIRQIHVFGCVSHVPVAGRIVRLACSRAARMALALSSAASLSLCRQRLSALIVSALPSDASIAAPVASAIA